MTLYNLVRGKGVISNRFSAWNWRVATYICFKNLSPDAFATGSFSWCTGPCIVDRIGKRYSRIQIRVETVEEDHSEEPSLEENLRRLVEWRSVGLRRRTSSREYAMTCPECFRKKRSGTLHIRPRVCLWMVLWIGPACHRLILKTCGNSTNRIIICFSLAYEPGLRHISNIFI